MAMSATPRLFVESDLVADGVVRLVEEQAHYFTRVLRLKPGATVRVFNGRDGEFEAELGAAAKNSAELRIGPCVRPQQAPPDLWLLFAPLKKTRTDFLVEKAVELGVGEICPVLTQRCEAQAVRSDRLQRIAIEAAEQTERLDVPPVREAQRLDAALQGWDPSRPLYFCDEAGEDGDRPWGGPSGRAAPMVDVLRQSPSASGAVLIGPEGGFSPAERKMLRSLDFVRPVSLGPRILRAETAAAAALTIWQAISGDWRASGQTH
jgi:16S rRNA (uracil1498-N3)-methyltransferase